MISEESAFLWSDRLYAALLSLYPFEFRLRFGSEMALLFRDCCRDQMQKRSLRGLAGVWLRAVLDLATSIPREQGRACRRSDLPARAAGLIDSVVILGIIGFHLLIAGILVAICVPRSGENFLLVSGVSSIALGVMGVMCSVILSRNRRIPYRFIGL
jgi:hypothetical protein